VKIETFQDKMNSKAIIGISKKRKRNTVVARWTVIMGVRQGLRGLSMLGRIVRGEGLVILVLILAHDGAAMKGWEILRL
jgi:hypothetical protein